MAILVLGLILFLGVHSLKMVAPDWRQSQIASRGEGPWKGVYSVLSILGLVLVVWGYSRAQPVAPVIYVPPFWLAHLVLLLMALGFVSLAVSVSPAGRLKPIAKHPMLLAVKIWAFSHLLVNGDLASILLFGAFLAWAVTVRISLKRRGAPIAAPGPVRNDAIAVAAGLIVWLAFIWKLHEWLIGVPVPMAA